MQETVNTVNLEMLRSASVIDVIKDGRLVRNVPATRILVTSESDLSHLQCCPGSIAYTAGFQSAWQLAADGRWISMAKPPAQDAVAPAQQGVRVDDHGECIMFTNGMEE